MMSKKFLLPGVAVLLCVFCLAACAQPAAEEGTESGGIASIEGYVEPPADTAQYRGEIAAVAVENGETVLTLKQVEGTDFGTSELRVAVTGDTQSSADISTLMQGDYVEVWYGGGQQEVEDALVLNLLPVAQSSVFNGTLVELVQQDDSSGSILLAPVDGGEEMLFSYDAGTSVYVNLQDLMSGDEINVFFSGASTMSVPPQAYAWELRQVYAS
ncbi:hypothetical protein LJC56_03825 [Christensenellaceae bacterium OttesenSCG-928-K19]|nr:hypothetical protein [Christensenellaceae bacterium OttesenSCG-928-K19]